MKKILFFLTIILLFSGCASLAVPRFQNMRSYEPTDCDPVLSVHIPQAVAMQYELMKALKENPSLADKIIPVSTLIDSIAKNGAAVGLGSAAIITAFKDDISVASVVSAATVGGIKAVADVRSEDKTQDRVDVCFSKEADFLYYKNEDQVLFTGRNNTTKKDVEKLVTEAEKAGGDNNE